MQLYFTLAMDIVREKMTYDFLVGNTTRPTCKVDVGDIVALECPVNTCTWERDGRAVCDNSTCTLDALEPDDFGLYTCVEYEIVLIAGKNYLY